MNVLHEAGLNIIVAHFNHRLRPESNAEAKAVGDAAARLNVPYVVENADVRQNASQEKISIEEAARNLRYGFLLAQARQYKAQAVAVGHTADDQVETVLMHFIRGAGLNGLQGMAYRTFLPAFDEEIPIIRPLLDIWRQEVIGYCTVHDLTPHFDPSNDSLDFFRNRVRHELIPMLESYNSRFREAILRSANNLSADFTLVKGWLDASWVKCVLSESVDYIALDLKALTEHSEAQLRHLIRRAVVQLNPLQEIDSAVLERATVFIIGSKGSHMDLIGGFSITREDNTIYINKQDAQLPFDEWPQMPSGEDALSISVPGQTALAADWILSSDKCGNTDIAQNATLGNHDRFQAWLDEDSLPMGLELRVMRPGDKLVPLGMAGHSQKLSDLFTNAKLPRRARKRWPLLCSNEIVIWIPGFSQSEIHKMTKDTRRIVHFHVHREKLAI